MQDALVQWWYGHNAVAFFLTTPILGHFLARRLGFLPCLFEVAQRHGSAVRTVFGFAATYNVAAAGLCLAGAMNPLLAAILMPSVSDTN